MTVQDAAAPPLTPRPVSGLLQAAAQLYLRRFATFYAWALGAGVVSWLLTGLPARPVAPVRGASAPGAAFLIHGGLAANPLLSLLAGLIDLGVTGVLFAIAGAAARGGAESGLAGSGDSAEGEAAGDGPAAEGPAAALRIGLARLWPLLVVSVVSGVLIALGLIVLVVPGVVLLTWWALAPVVTVLERRRAMASLGRSRALVRGRFWHTLGTVFFGGLIVAVAYSLLALLGLPLHRLPGGFGPHAYALWGSAARAAVAPYSACLVTLLCYDLRLRGRAQGSAVSGTAG